MKIYIVNKAVELITINPQRLKKNVKYLIFPSPLTLVLDVIVTVLTVTTTAELSVSKTIAVQLQTHRLGAVTRLLRSGIYPTVNS